VVSSNKNTHLDILPGLLDFIQNPLESTPSDIVNNLEGTILDIIYDKSIDPVEDEMITTLNDFEVVHCRPDRVYDYHGSRIDLLKPSFLTDVEYKLLVKNILLTIAKGPTFKSIDDALTDIFGAHTLLEMKNLTSLPEFRKIFRVNIPLFSSPIGQDAIDAYNVLVTFLDIVKPATSHYDILNILEDEFGPLTDIDFIVVKMFPAGPGGLDPLVGSGLGKLDNNTNFERTGWSEYTCFSKNNFSNSYARKNNFDSVYCNFESGKIRDLDTVSVVIS